jgi:pre-mRNA-splicing factor ATP-dependent RNA helicase DHX15/PRP43
VTNPSACSIMAGERKRGSDASDTVAAAKRVKMEKEEGLDEDKKAIQNNPYLAHMKEDDDEKNGGYDSGALPKGSPLHKFTRRETTAKQAAKAEDNDANPFTGEPHSQQYFKILDGRRNLPVHKQR